MLEAAAPLLIWGVVLHLIAAGREIVELGPCTVIVIAGEQ